MANDRTDTRLATTQLAEEMERRRVKIGREWQEVASDAGMTAGHLLKIRQGKVPITDKAARGIERGLKWQERSIDDILNDGNPTPLVDEPQKAVELRDDIEKQIWGMNMPEWRKRGLIAKHRLMLALEAEEREADVDNLRELG